MFFILLVFASALAIEGIGTIISVIGLSALFMANPLVIALAVCLDIAKITAVSFVYKYWSKINLLMKTYMTLATVVLVTITSAGAFGFLSGEFQKAIASTSQADVIIKSLDEEKIRLQKRKEEIDKQIAQLPDTNVRGRTQLLKQFGPEINRVNSRLAEIDQKLPELRVQNIQKEVKVGPIIYIANAFDTTPEKAVKWVILTIIFVFDPLAIALLIAGNFLIELRRREREAGDVRLLEPSTPTHNPAFFAPAPQVDDLKHEVTGQSNDLKSSHITPADGNVFADLGFPAEDSMALLREADKQIQADNYVVERVKEESLPVEDNKDPVDKPKRGRKVKIENDVIKFEQVVPETAEANESIHEQTQIGEPLSEAVVIPPPHTSSLDKINGNLADVVFGSDIKTSMRKTYTS